MQTAAAALFKVLKTEHTNPLAGKQARARSLCFVYVCASQRADAHR